MTKSWRELADTAQQMKRHYQNVIDMAEAIGDGAALKQLLDEKQQAINALENAHADAMKKHAGDIEAAQNAVQVAKDEYARKVADAQARSTSILTEAGAKADAIIAGAKATASGLLKPIQETKAALEQDINALRGEKAKLETELSTHHTTLAGLRADIESAKSQMAKILKAHGLE